MGTFTAKNRQSVADLCLQLYGKLDLMFKLCQDNLIDNICVDNLSQRRIVIDDSLINDKLIVITNYYATNYATNYATSKGAGSYNDDYSNDYDN